MFYKTKINKNISKRKSARNYCNDELILMDGVWLMKGYPEPNAPLKRTLSTMKDIEEVKDVVEDVLDRKFDKVLHPTPIEFRGAKAFYNPELKQYHFVNSDFVEMVNFDKCRCIGTENKFDPIIFENVGNSDQWLLVMPLRLNDVDRWLRRP